MVAKTLSSYRVFAELGRRAMRAALVLILFCSVAHADDSSKARAHALFKQGEAAYQTGRYDDAIREYSEAFSLVPLPLLLFDLGQAYRLKGDRLKAIDNYNKYLDVDPNGRGAPEARQHVLELQAELKKEAEAKRAAEEARKQAEQARKQADEARRRADEEGRRKASEEARLRAEHEAQARAAAVAEGRRRADEEKRQKLEARRRRAAEDAARPLWKKPWFWGVLAGAAVAAGVAVGMGVAYGSPDKDPLASFGRVPAN